MSLRGINVLALAVAAQVAASANMAAVDVSGFVGECRLVLNASATLAADNVLNVKIQQSADGVTNWTDTGIAFAPVTNAAASHQVIGVNVDRFSKFIRVVDTLTGTTPKCNRCVELVAKADR